MISLLEAILRPVRPNSNAAFVARRLAPLALGLPLIALFEVELIVTSEPTYRALSAQEVQTLYLMGKWGRDI
jgi:hypothetical protein